MQSNYENIPVAFLQEHHNEMMGCLMLKKGVQKKADKAILKDFTNSFWTDDLQKHIKKEEEVLIPFLVRHSFENRYVNMLKTDHEIMQCLVDRLNMYDDRYRVFEIFASIVEQHFQFEERIIFNEVQDRVNENEMKKLGIDLQVNSSRKFNDYPVKFWD